MKYLKSFGLALLYLGATYSLFPVIDWIIYESSLMKFNAYREIIIHNPHISLLTWFLISFLILFILTKWIKKKSIFEYCGLSGISGKEIFIMIYIGIGAFLFNTAAINISFIDKFFPQLDEFVGFNYGMSHIVLGVICSVIVGPIFEEFLFRGLIYKELRNVLPVIPSAVITSILYGVMFFNIPFIVFCFIAGLLYSFVYIQTKTLVPIFVIQFVATFSVLITRRLGIENVISDIGDIYIIPAFIMSILICVSGCYLLWKLRNTRNKGIEEGSPIYA